MSISASSAAAVVLMFDGGLIGKRRLNVVSDGVFGFFWGVGKCPEIAPI